MYLITILLGLTAAVLMLRGGSKERDLRAHQNAGRFHTRIVVDEPGKPRSSQFLRYAYYVVGRRARRADIPLTDPTVSRPHGELWYSRGKYYIKPVFHRRKKDVGAKFSQVYVNYEAAPAQGRCLECYNQIDMGRTRMWLEDATPESVPCKLDLRIPALAAAFTLCMSLFVSLGAAGLELDVGRMWMGSVCIVAFLALGTVWSVLTQAPMLSFLSAVSTLLTLHNSYMIFFPKESGYIFHMIIFMVVMTASFLVLRDQDRFSNSDLLFYLLAGAVVGLMALNVLLGKGSQYSSSRLWIRIGGLSIQPGELVKPMLAMLGALSYRNHKRFWIYFACTGLTCGILVLLKDFGNVFVIFAMLLLMIYLLYDNIAISLGTIAVSLLAFIIVLNSVEYARVRFGNWGLALQEGGNYQQGQVLKSVIYGGIRGLGVQDHSYATRIFAAESDTALSGIYAIYGMPMLAVVMLTYGSIVNQSVSSAAVYPMGNLLLVQAALAIFAQVMLNFCGAMDILPFTGVVAPLISAGGSGMMSQGIFMGMIAASLNPMIHPVVRE